MIKFTFFDVGGVVINDFSKGNKLEEMRDMLGIGNQWLSIINFFSRRFPTLYNMWLNNYVNRFQKNESIWPVISEINKTSKIGLLTNMHPKMLEKIKEFNLVPELNWDRVVDSSKVNLRKPNLEIYKYAEKVVGVSGEDILFIDNGFKNIEAAKKLGWKTFLYDPYNSFDSNIKLLKYINELQD